MPPQKAKNAPKLSPIELIGQNAYFSIIRTARLTTIMKQQGEDQAPFRAILQALKTMPCTKPMWELLCRRYRSHDSMTQADRDSFRDALRIFPKRR